MGVSGHSIIITPQEKITFNQLLLKFSQEPKLTRSSKLNTAVSARRSIPSNLCRGISLEGRACSSLAFGGKLSVVMDVMQDGSEFIFEHRAEKGTSTVEVLEFVVQKQGGLISFRSCQCTSPESASKICEFCNVVEKNIASFHDELSTEEVDEDCVISCVRTAAECREEHLNRQKELMERRQQMADSGEESAPTTELLFQPDKLTLLRFQRCWELFLANSKRLTAARFPHNAKQRDYSSLLFLPRAGEMMWNHDYTMDDWFNLTSKLRSVEPTSFTRQPNRKFIDTSAVTILPGFALLELSLSQRSKTHVFPPLAFYTRLCRDEINRTQRWSSATAQRYFAEFTTGGVNSLKRLSYMLEPDAVLHFLIHDDFHYSLLVFFNVSSRAPEQDSAHFMCRLGIDCLLTHNVEVFADNIAM